MKFHTEWKDFKEFTDGENILIPNNLIVPLVQQYIYCGCFDLQYRTFSEQTTASTSALRAACSNDAVNIEVGEY